jgi:hypothetical protein
MNDARVRYVEFAPQSAPYGCDYHPSVATHQAMATVLIPAIKNATGW